MARIVQGDAGKVICKEAEKLKPAAVIMGTRGRSLIQRYKLYFKLGNYMGSFSNSYMNFLSDLMMQCKCFRIYVLVVTFKVFG